MPFYIKKIHFWNRDPKSKCHKNGFKRKRFSSRQLTFKTRDWYRNFATVKQNLDKKSYFERQKENKDIIILGLRNRAIEALVPVSEALRQFPRIICVLT